jgi:hypothetical protein
LIFLVIAVLVVWIIYEAFQIIYADAWAKTHDYRNYLSDDYKFKKRNK